MNKQHKKTEYTVINEKKIVFPRFTVVLEQILKESVEYQYSYLKTFDSVCILPLVGEKVLLIREYRHTFRSWIYEIPGGGVDKKLTLIENAKKELLEETGYSALKIKPLGFYYPSPGLTTEKTYLYVAKCKKTETLHLEPLELIETKLMHINEFENLIVNNQFLHGMGLIAWQKYKAIKDKASFWR